MSHMLEEQVAHFPLSPMFGLNRELQMPQARLSKTRKRRSPLPLSQTFPCQPSKNLSSAEAFYGRGEP